MSAPFIEPGAGSTRRVWRDETRSDLLGFVWCHRGALRELRWWRGARAPQALKLHTKACASAEEAAAELVAGRVTHAGGRSRPAPKPPRAEGTIDRDAIGRRISSALKRLLDEARCNGCSNPKLFFEAESAAVFVLDGDHPGYVDGGKIGVHAGKRQEAIVLRAAISVPFDTGAW